VPLRVLTSHLVLLPLEPQVPVSRCPRSRESFKSPGGNGATYETLTTYDTLGRPDKLLYPQAPNRPRFTLQTTYNTSGYPVDINDVSDPAKPVTLSHVGNRNLDGNLTAGNLGANVRLINTYDPVTGRTTDLTAINTNTGAQLQKLHYTYYSNGLVKTRDQDDTSGKRAEAYRYDEFNRLTGWDLTNATSPKTTTTYGFDTIGNLTSVTNTTGITPTETRTHGNTSRNAGPHALNTNTTPDTTGPETYTYDKQGRMTQTTLGTGTALRKVTYTPFDLPKTITTLDGKTTTFAYDAFGTRVKKTGPDGTTFTVPGLFDKRTDTTGKTSYVYYLAGIGQAVHNGTTTTLEYTLTDTLGSTGTVINASGNKTNAFFYDPYGKQTNPDGTKYTGTTGTHTHRFTGHEHDDTLRLINMNGRLYDPYAKTFLTTDPITDNHPYTYVNSNPTNYTDPTGYDEWSSGSENDCFACNDSYIPPPLPQEEATQYSNSSSTAICGGGSVAACDTPNNAGSDTTGYHPAGAHPDPATMDPQRAQAGARLHAIDAEKEGTLYGKLEALFGKIGIPDTPFGERIDNSLATQASANDPVGAVERGLDIADTVISLQQLQNSLEGHINTPAVPTRGTPQTFGVDRRGNLKPDSAYAEKYGWDKAYFENAEAPAVKNSVMGHGSVRSEDGDGALPIMEVTHPAGIITARPGLAMPGDLGRAVARGDWDYISARAAEGNPFLMGMARHLPGKLIPAYTASPATPASGLNGYIPNPGSYVPTEGRVSLSTIQQRMASDPKIPITWAICTVCIY
ncbi:RHS repeat-associated core domain-containing protein, partial [Streptomyces sp. NPDC052013]|uniref:RHS repeat-associated core domain-containing protein n=1 Tax=Streptomyces sp. NPDC052013 TaxID=3365679 RepID=UPI0037D917D4